MALDSSNKCNKMVIEYLVGGFEAQDLTRTVIKTVSNEPDIGVRQSSKVGFLWKVLSDKTVGVLVGASLPGRIRVGKEEVCIEGIGDLLMAHELDAVVARDGKDLVFVREEFPADSVCDRFGRLWFSPSEAAGTWTAFRPARVFRLSSHGR